MKITIESTDALVEIQAYEGPNLMGTVPARVWVGKTESGIEVHCLITRIAVSLQDDQAQFEKELKETRAPISGLVEVFPQRMIL
jgi:hypothetical protein